jgi:aryl-alcohol dehydrogenase-like predicted oxidoreductase
MNFAEPALLGKTGLKVGRLGISSSYGAPTAAFEEAFDRGCNYWTWGTFIRGRSSEMKRAIRAVAKKGLRDRLVLAMLTYAHSAWVTDYFFHKGLKAAGIDYADILLLGYFPRRPPQRVIDGALKLKEKGLVRFIGLTSHNRKVFKPLAEEALLDVFHVRYNAAHRGAETEVFPFMVGDNRPGIVSFTATCWGKLLNSKKRPPSEPPASAPDCYRFVLSNPSVDVAMVGARTLAQMRENLTLLDTGPMDEQELERMRRIGRKIEN